MIYLFVLFMPSLARARLEFGLDAARGCQRKVRSLCLSESRRSPFLGVLCLLVPKATFCRAASSVQQRSYMGTIVGKRRIIISTCVRQLRLHMACRGNHQLAKMLPCCLFLLVGSLFALSSWRGPISIQMCNGGWGIKGKLLSPMAVLGLFMLVPRNRPPSRC